MLGRSVRPSVHTVKFLPIKMHNIADSFPHYMTHIKHMMVNKYHHYEELYIVYSNFPPKKMALKLYKTLIIFFKYEEYYILQLKGEKYSFLWRRQSCFMKNMITKLRKITNYKYIEDK